MSWREQYYQRVRPVIGEVFEESSVAFWGLSRHHLLADALAKSGITQQFFFDSAAVSQSAFSRSLGREHIGTDKPRAVRLTRHIKAHNAFESDWQLEVRPQTTAAVAECLKQQSPSLLCIECDAHVRDVARAAIDAEVPFVLSWQGTSALPASLVLAWHPDVAHSRAELLTFLQSLSELPRLDDAATANHLDVLETSSLALGLTRWLLARDRPQRRDLERPIVEQGKLAVIRGEPGWPWSVQFARPNTRLLSLCASGGRRYRAPAGLASPERLLVMGLGTASLACLEAPLFANQMMLIDCKAVSPFNPVRQAYPTSRIGQRKAWALAEILAQRQHPGATHHWRNTPRGYDELTVNDQRVCAAELMLKGSDRGSKKRFAELLDDFQPTLARHSRRPKVPCSATRRGCESCS
jgi:hypothetical protein